MVELVIIGVILIGLGVGSYTDMRTREVPDWVNFSLIAIGFSIHAIASLVFQTWSYIINSVAGFLLCLIISLAMFYTGQWGGGDSKMIMGLGALIGLRIFNIEYINYSLISFLVNILIIGAFYGLFWSIILSIKHRKQFVKEANRIFSNKKIVNAILLVSGLILIFLIIFSKNLLLQINLFMILMLILLYYLYYYIKIVEKACMYKYVTPDKLTEGDWIAKDVKVKSEYVTGPKELGVTKKQINKLLKFYGLGKVKKILIKEGIPFIPSFLIAFIITLAYGNIIYLVILT